MPDRGKVLRALKQHLLAHDDDECVGCPYFELEPHECERQLYADVLELLKEQEPVSPIQPELSGIWFCGSCKYAISRNIKFCPNCGMGVKWE